MKKMFFGSLIFLGGLLGVLVSFIVAGLNPGIYYTHFGLYGWLLKSGAIGPLFFFSIMAFIGIIICYREAYLKN